MQVLINQSSSSSSSSWHQQLRESSAVEKLRRRQFDQFPLAQLQGLTDDFVKAAASRWFLRRAAHEIVPFSVGCDQLFDHELSKLRQSAGAQLGMVHAGVLSCIHVLTTSGAVAQLSSLMPDVAGGNPVWDEMFDEKAALYLQCLIIAHSTRPRLYSSQEARASKQLLRIAIAASKDKSYSFPAISLARLFGTVGPDAGCAELLPDELISAVLDRARFKAAIGTELERLRAARMWYEAYVLVKSLNPLLYQEQRHQQNRATALIQEFIPHYTFWAAWKPSRTRVELWKNHIPSTHWPALAPVFDLEGPDVTGHQRHTIRQSPSYLITGTPGFIHLSADGPVVERILNLLDLAASVGPHSIDLFIHQCITAGPPTPMTLARLTSVLETARGCGSGDWTSRIMQDYLASLHASPELRLSPLAQVLGLMTRIPKLQATLSTSLDIQRTAVDTLSASQSMFCESLEGSYPHEALGYDIIALGRAMLDATWLHSHWDSWYLSMLRQIPSQGEVETTLRELRTATAQNNASVHEALIDHLVTKLGNRSRRNTQSVLLTGNTSLLFLSQDPIWYEPLDIDRSRLRDFMKTIPGMTPTLATVCIKRSLEEDSAFIHALNRILLGCTDAVCVNLAGFLGPRTMHARFQIDECWKALLMHMMQQRSPGMLERAAVSMDLAKLRTWDENLVRLFGDRHLDPHGQMGFTAEKLRGIIRAKIQ